MTALCPESHASDIGRAHEWRRSVGGKGRSGGRSWRSYTISLNGCSRASRSKGFCLPSYRARRYNVFTSPANIAMPTKLGLDQQAGGVGRV